MTTESYQVARQYMVRLGPRDFIDAAWVAVLAKAAGLGEDAFRTTFGRFATSYPQRIEQAASSNVKSDQRESTRMPAR